MSESQILRVLGDVPPDSFSVLNRRVKQALSDTAVVKVLLARGDGGPETLPIPLATRFTRLTRPLDYLTDPAPDPEDEALAGLPIPYRVARVVLWLGVAAEMIVVIVNSLHLN